MIIYRTLDSINLYISDLIIKILSYRKSFMSNIIFNRDISDVHIFYLRNKILIFIFEKLNFPTMKY